MVINPSLDEENDKTAWVTDSNSVAGMKIKTKYFNSE